MYLMQWCILWFTVKNAGGRRLHLIMHRTMGLMDERTRTMVRGPI